VKILLDTCTFLWLALDDKSLSPQAIRLFKDPDHEIFLSTVSCWEMAVKYALGRLELPATPADVIPSWRESHGISTLPLEENAAVYEYKLPKLHNDPFDRMLICQSIVHGMAMLTPDRDISRYAINVLW